jgi:hypothetical protein
MPMSLPISNPNPHWGGTNFNNLNQLAQAAIQMGYHGLGQSHPAYVHGPPLSPAQGQLHYGQGHGQHGNVQFQAQGNQHSINESPRMTRSGAMRTRMQLRPPEPEPGLRDGQQIGDIGVDRGGLDDRMDLD